MPSRRKLDILILSDIHLGTFGCHAAELNAYLKTVKPQTLILNGDIIDMWQFNKYYFPASHIKVLKRIIGFVSEGTEVYYLTGNHDDNLRRFTDLHMGNFHLSDKLLISIGNKKAWVFHGDVFDLTMKYSKVVARLGSIGYNTLIFLNRAINKLSMMAGYGKVSLSKKIKDSVKSAIKFIDDFETTATDLGIESGYDFVICGHIHRPVIKRVTNKNGSIMYLNSGDWIENLTALEFSNGEWTLFQYDEKDFINSAENEAEEENTSAIPAVQFEDMILQQLRL